jgi:hypothetical protein
MGWDGMRWDKGLRGDRTPSEVVEGHLGRGTDGANQLAELAAPDSGYARAWLRAARQAAAAAPQALIADRPQAAAAAAAAMTPRCAPPSPTWTYLPPSPSENTWMTSTPSAFHSGIFSAYAVASGVGSRTGGIRGGR